MLGNDRMKTTSTEVMSTRYRNNIQISTWRTRQYFVDFESRIHFEISMSNRCHNFHVDSSFKIDEILTNVHWVSKGKEIKPGEIEFDWGKKHAPYAKEQFSLKADILFRTWHPFWFSGVTNLDGFANLLVGKSNLHAQQNGREFYTNKREMRGFLGISYIMSINKLPTIKSY